MVDNVKKYIIRTELDTKGVVKQYDDMMRKLSDIDRKYSRGRGSGRGGGPRGSPTGRSAGGGRSFQDTQRFHNMNVGMGDMLSQLRSMPKAGIHKDLVGQIGSVQSRIADLRNQLSRVSNGRELANLTIKYREARTEAMALLRANQKYNKSLGITNTLSNKFVSSLKHAGLAAVSVYGLAKLGGVVFNVGKEMDAMRASLLAASKDAAEAPKNFEFLRETSFELGKDIQTMTGGFNRLGVAAKAAGLDTKQIQEIFLAASEASTTFALDNQRTGLVMLAMSQIMSKGFYEPRCTVMCS